LGQIIVFIFELILNQSDRYKNKTKTRSIPYKLRLMAGLYLKLTLLFTNEKYVSLVRNSHAATKVSKGKNAMSQ